ncbi:MAG: MBL fold metallo-hydrolase [Candidatus Lernaella stagnicola]|nr:MBL fold metallo-hydrolase [Candidatus Lernaella stagnicola]
MRKINDRVFCLCLDTPFPVGSTNVYFIADRLPTLIDTGPNVERCATELQKALHSIGYHFADIKRILVTHPHIDHFGLAARIKIESGARVYAMEGARDMLADIQKEWDANDKYFTHFLHFCGVPDPQIQALLQAGRDYVRYGCQVDLDEPLSDGDEIEFDDFSLRVLHTPGHTPHDASFESPEMRVIFVGDTLQARIAPSILLARPTSPTGSRPRVVLQHMQTLKRLMNTKATLALPGHGRPFGNPRDAAEKTLRHHRRRRNEVFHMLNGRARTPYDIAREMTEDLPDFELFLWVSEIVGYLELLEEQGQVTQEFRENCLFFQGVSEDIV